jgi:transposase-like protein
MVTHDSGISPAPVEGACRATRDETAHNCARPERFSAPKKTEVVLRLLRGEEIDLLSRELGVPAARLAAWRDTFLSGGQEAMKKQPLDARDREIARLREKLGESTMDNELLREKLARVETGRPLRRRRSS